MSYHSTWFLKRDIRDFQGTLFKEWCALKEGVGEKVLLNNSLLIFTNIACSVGSSIYAILFNPYNNPCQRKIAPDGLNS